MCEQQQKTESQSTKVFVFPGERKSRNTRNAHKESHKIFWVAENLKISETDSIYLDRGPGSIRNNEEKGGGRTLSSRERFPQCLL